MLRQVVSSMFNNNRLRTNTFTNYQGIRGVGLPSGATGPLHRW
jgi:hypothetical protein